MPKFRQAFAAGSLAFSGACAVPAGALAAESAYTDFSTDACTVLSRQAEGESVRLRCPGLKGVPLLYSEGDGRAEVDFGVANDDFSSFDYFNSVGDRIEWRLADGKPFAAIVRFKLDSGLGDGKKLSDVLVVEKVGTKAAPGCPMAAIDVSAVEQANGVARGVAALAPGFNCSIDKPVAIGGADSVATRFAQAVPEGR